MKVLVAGARPVVADALDRDAVAQAVAAAEPEVIVHQLTPFSEPFSIRDARRPDRKTQERLVAEVDAAAKRARRAEEAFARFLTRSLSGQQLEELRARLE